MAVWAAGDPAPPRVLDPPPCCLNKRHVEVGKEEERPSTLELPPRGASRPCILWRGSLGPCSTGDWKEREWEEGGRGWAVGWVGGLKNVSRSGC
jgi:hypothetical protein